MYNTQEIVQRIKTQLKSQGMTTSTMLAELGMGVNTLSEFAKGKQLSSVSLARIADYLDVSLDDLLGRTSHISYGGIKENSFVGQGSGISNTNQFTTNDTLDDDTKEVIRILKSLSPRKRHELIGIIFDFADENM